MNAKPILVVRFPQETEQDKFGQSINHLRNHPLSEEYHVLAMTDNSVDRVSFETHNVMSQDPIKVEELIESFKSEYEIN